MNRWRSTGAHRRAADARPRSDDLGAATIRRVIPLRGLALALGAAMGTILPFMSVILASFGFEPGEIGLLTAVGAIVFTLAVPAWGHLADVRFGRPRTFQICAIGAMIAILSLLGAWPMAIVALLYLWFSAFQSAWQPLADAITVNALRGESQGYARVRVLSSVSFAIASIVSGFIYDRTGYPAAFVLCSVSILIAVAAAAGIRDVGRADLDAERLVLAPEAADALQGTRTWRFGSVGVAMARAPRLWIIFTAAGLIFVGFLTAYTFLPLYLTQSLGGQPSDVALSAGVSALAEIPSMLLMGRLVQRLGLRAVFVIGVLCNAAAFASWTVITNPELIIATRVLTGIAYASIIVASVLTIARLLPPELQATGQALFQTTAFGIAAVISNFIGGLLYANVGPTSVFAFGVVLALGAAVVGWIGFPRRDDPTAVRQSPS
jgi:MFS transporter, PPP family, 3-phenylpropionic acid transporter